MTDSPTDVYAAIASPVRRAVLDLLRDGPRPVREIAAAFPVSRPAISQHLAVLREAELVAERKAGRERLYELDARRLAEVDGWIAKYEVFWKSKLRALGRLLDDEAAGADEAGPGATDGERAGDG